MLLSLPNALTLIMLCSLTASSVNAKPSTGIRLRVYAGRYARTDTPVRWSIPESLSLKGEYELVQTSTGKAIPVQRDGDRALVWILPGTLEAGDVATFDVSERHSETSVSASDLDKKHLLFRARGHSVMRYNYGLMNPPAEIESIYARSGYIHPIWSPSGRIVSNDFPENHKHHHGIWFPWTGTVFEGREVDFWNSGKGQGKVECTGVDGFVEGAVFAGFGSRHRFIDLTAPGSPKEALKESWKVKVYPHTDYFLGDFRSVQECAGPSPLKLKKYRYGGFGFRGSGQWEGIDGCEYLTSEGRTRLNGHATTARWCAIFGKVDGATVGITFFCHPNNFRAPQNMRIHPKEPFFNFAPCQAGDFEIVPDQPYESRYRFVVYDGVPNVVEMERLWHDYAYPPVVNVDHAPKG